MHVGTANPNTRLLIVIYIRWEPGEPFHWTVHIWRQYEGVSDRADVPGPHAHDPEPAQGGWVQETTLPLPGGRGEPSLGDFSSSHLQEMCGFSLGHQVPGKKPRRTHHWAATWWTPSCLCLLLRVQMALGRCPVPAGSASTSVSVSSLLSVMRTLPLDSGGRGRRVSSPESL